MGKGPLEQKLQFEKKNQDLVKLPKCLLPLPPSAGIYHERLTPGPTDAQVEKRPIPHAPIASPYAGASVPKIVYVSTGTPFMSAVKRVQKLLRQAEKRATASISLEDTRTTEKQKISQLAKVSELREEVFVKATGRAIEKALNVGKWFEGKETEYAVRVTTGSVLVVDDVVENEQKKEWLKLQRLKDQGQAGKDGSDTQQRGAGADSTPPQEQAAKPSAKKRKRQNPAPLEDVELPECRTRWVKTVEVAVTLK
ncbi:hypothetical protein N7492_008865 [Penicillium capsulatum]|uniref:Uncharacterized protein n=1 Tax=Penicillium capsulatum TaxID=69766 RepID=A0A9W9HS60_9EURO|nr:hypothetical protein N7492_008865 [Penicillium capsulatum]KAJ6106267.1 hypothetical protein N7512_009784 [Penicillium capsulatum]